MSVLDGLRGSGRTTRMLEHARRLDAEHRAVYILTDNVRHADALRPLLADHPGIKVEVAAPSNFEWSTMRLRGAHPNCVVLVDHFAIERRFAALLEELHRYDPPTGETP